MPEAEGLVQRQAEHLAKAQATAPFNSEARSFSDISTADQP
jgi:hypothetical protein